jgi:hypothetical protein
MLAVLEDGITCFQGYFSKPSRTNEKLFLEAEEWIGSNDDGVFSFDNVCETLGLNPKALRKGLQQWRAKQIGVAPQERSTSCSTKGNLLGRKIPRSKPPTRSVRDQGFVETNNGGGKLG